MTKEVDDNEAWIAITLEGINTELFEIKHVLKRIATALEQKVN